MARANRNTEVATRPTANVARAGDNVFTMTAAALGSDGGGVIFGKFNGNNGDFTYGTSPVLDLDPGTEVMVDMQMAVKRGWICWKDGEVVDEQMIGITKGKPSAEDDLEDHSPYKKKDDGWKEQISLRFKIVGTGEEVELKMTSRAGIRGVGALCKAYGAEFRDHGPTDMIIVVLDSKGYDPRDKSYGRKYAPIFEIDRFITVDEAAELFGEAGDVADEAPVEVAPQTQAPAPAVVADEGVIPTLDDGADGDATEVSSPPVAQEAPSTAPRSGRRTKRV